MFQAIDYSTKNIIRHCLDFKITYIGLTGIYCSYNNTHSHIVLHRTIIRIKLIVGFKFAEILSTSTGICHSLIIVLQIHAMEMPPITLLLATLGSLLVVASGYDVLLHTSSIITVMNDEGLVMKTVQSFNITSVAWHRTTGDIYFSTHGVSKGIWRYKHLEQKYHKFIYHIIIYIKTDQSVAYYNVDLGCYMYNHSS